MKHRLTGRVEWGPGPVGDAVGASLEGRLKRFVLDEESEPVVLFSPEARAVSDAGDWYGEHLGKWLVAASHAARRTGDPDLATSIRRVVAALAGWQEADGYLGTYAPGAACRMTDPRPEGVRTWDVWVHAWMALGLLAASGSLPFAGGSACPDASGCRERKGLGMESEGPPTLSPRPPLSRAKEGENMERGASDPLAAAVRIGDLLLEAFAERSPLDQGNHMGLSAGCVVHPLAELTLATGDPRYAALARRTVDEMEVRLGLLSKADVAEIGTGKAYQILWVLVGLVALHRATGDTDLLGAAQRLWTNVHDRHLTPLGGPWGGLQGHKETFAPAGAFSPYGMVETCAAATWMVLSRDLFVLTGEEKYVAAFERTLMNSLLGALDGNGRDWVYFTFPNGRRNNTYYWACCRSSGATALEECSDMVASATDDAIWLHLLLPCRVEIEGATIEVAEDLTIRYEGEKPLRVRSIVDWRLWGADEPPQSTIHNPQSLRVVPFTHTVEHHGQEIVRHDYAYLQRGPYVYATGLIDGYKKEETLRLPRLTPEAPFRSDGDDILLHGPGRAPIRFEPYWRAGGRHEGAWRTTWLSIAWQ